MDVDRRVALSNFYREEFLRHIEHMHAAGILDERSEIAERAREAFMTRLDALCGVQGFPAVAESLLASFAALSGLGSFDARRRH
jgi:hypothetical protein